MTTVMMSRKGSIVIPAELRRKYKLVPGRPVEIVDYAGILSIHPVMSNPVEEARGMLKGGPSLSAILLEEHRRELSADK